MKRLIRFLTRSSVDVVVFILVIAAAGYLLYRVALPGWVEARVRSLLAERGLPGARFELTQVGVGGAVLRGLRLTDDEQAFAAESVELRFTPLELLLHRVDAVAIDGLRWRIAYADGKVDLGPVGALLAERRAAAEPAPTDAAPVPGVERIVVDDLAITNSVVELEYAGRAWSLPIVTAGSVFEASDAPYGLRYDAAAGALVVEAPVAELAGDSLVAVALKEELGIAATGRAGAEVRIALDGRISAKVTVDDVTAGYGEADGGGSAYELTGLRGEVAFDSLAPLSTPPGQQVTWTGAQVSDVMLGRGVLRFAIESPESVHVERLRIEDIAGGQYRVMAVRFNPAAPDVSIDLFVENLSLDGVLDTLSFGQASAVGRMTGRVPIRVATRPRLRVALGQGVLVSQNEGRLHVARADLVDMVMKQGGLTDDADYAAVVRQRLVQALQDLQYSRLMFVTHEKAGREVLTAKVTGRGRESGQEVNLTVNINDYGDAIDVALRAALGLQRAGDGALRRALGGAE